MAFQSTIWTLIRQARERRGPALDDLVRLYWGPIRAFLERRGFGAADAEDLAQEVLVEVCKEDFLKKADASKGRFRSLLLAVTRNLAGHHARRRSRAVTLSREPEATAEEQADYNRLWATQVLRGALDRLKEENAGYAAAIELHFFEDRPHKEIAERLGKKDHDVKNFIFQGKRLLKEFIRDAIRAYCSSPGEFQEELDELSAYLP